jgi:hypothetical protein
MKETNKTKSQKEKFIETARELGCDESPEAFDKAFSKIVPSKPIADKPKEGK